MKNTEFVLRPGEKFFVFAIFTITNMRHVPSNRFIWTFIKSLKKTITLDFFLSQIINYYSTILKLFNYNKINIILFGPSCSERRLYNLLGMKLISLPLKKLRKLSGTGLKMASFCLKVRCNYYKISQNYF